MLHKKFDQISGLNRKGYRGEIVGRKKIGEYRIAVLGGSTAYGYGVYPHESYPAVLEKQLRQKAFLGVANVSVVNLAYNIEGSYAYTYNIRDFQYLGSDLYILYEGYNDLGMNEYVHRHPSPVFRWFGYFPIFPVVFSEKADVLRHGPNLELTHYGKNVPFDASLADQVKAGVLSGAAKAAKALEENLDRLSRARPVKTTVAPSTGCTEEWGVYCENVKKAVELVLSMEKKVLLLSQPKISESHVRQQTELRGMISRLYSSDPSVFYLDLSDAVDLKDTSIAYDGMHLVAEGNRTIASKITEFLMVHQERIKGGLEVGERSIH